MLKNMAVRFYADLFASNPEAGGSFIKGMFSPMEDMARHKLEEAYTIEEFFKALKEMGSLKVPGPDGYQALFFKQTWSKTGQALSSFVRGGGGAGRE